MNYKNYEKIMHLLGLIENELNEIAAQCGHNSFTEFMEEKNLNDVKNNTQFSALEKE